jgi:hypothetical protein
MKRIPLGIIVISVVMFFAAVATDIFWVGRLVGKAFPQTLPVEPKIYNAFAIPDIVLSLFLYVGAYGLLKLRKYGFMASIVAMGMWIFDCLLVLSITRQSWINIIGPILFFAFFSLGYLWVKKDLFD